MHVLTIACSAFKLISRQKRMPLRFCCNRTNIVRFSFYIVLSVPTRVPSTVNACFLSVPTRVSSRDLIALAGCVAMYSRPCSKDRLNYYYTPVIIVPWKTGMAQCLMRALAYPGARLLNVPETFRARKAIFS